MVDLRTALPRALFTVRDIGVADQPLGAVRRLRTLNLVALIGMVATFAYTAFWALLDLDLFWREVVFLSVMVVLYGATFLATRTGHVEVAMWIMIVVALLHIGGVNWLIGPNAGALGYLFVVPFIAALLMREGDRMTVWPVGVAAAVVFFVDSKIPHQVAFDTLPQPTQQIFYFVNVTGAVMLGVGVCLIFLTLMERAEAELQREQKRSEGLLRAILPAAIAERLKGDRHHTTIAERYPEATVVFADIVGFTGRSATMNPEHLVNDLNRVFSEVDMLAAHHGVEKIKTLGDGYLAVCGVPALVSDHAERAADFALDIKKKAVNLAQNTWPGLQFRIALHSGPVVAGVIGRSKFAYDVWGDTVNTTNRLMEICPVGEIVMSEAARSRLAERFAVAEHGAVDLRGVGTAQAYLLHGRCAGDQR